MSTQPGTRAALARGAGSLRALLPTGFLVLTAVVAGLVGALGVAISYRATVGPVVCGAHLCEAARPYRPLALIAAGLLAGCMLWSRPDKVREAPGWIEELVRAAREATIAVVGVLLFAFFWRPGQLPHRFSYSRAAVALDWAVTFILLAVARIGIKHIVMARRRRGTDLRTMVVVGKSGSAEAFIETIRSLPETGYRIVGQVDGSEQPEEVAPMLASIGATSRLDEVILASPCLKPEHIARLAEIRELRRTKIRAVPELFGLPPPKVQVTSFVCDFPLLSLFTEPLSGARRSIKRLIDVVASAVVLILTSPILLAAALAVRLGTEGPALFRQERVGMDGRCFEILKFRTMYDKADPALHMHYVADMMDSGGAAAAGLYKLAGDPRITPAGRLLRRLSIDELPQLLNVLRGEMSLVGPRPALAFEVDLYEDWQRRRLAVRPGVTGLWQVSGRSRLTTDEMLRLDVRYVETWSLVRDLLITLKTVPAVLRREAR